MPTFAWLPPRCNRTYNGSSTRRAQAGIGMRAGFYYRWDRPLAAILSLCFLGPAWNAQCAERARPFDFAHQVVPILKAHCVECHGGQRHEGDLSINTRESILDSGAVEPGKSADSHLIELVTS